MIELDEIREPQKNNYTPIVILGVVALLLVVIGFLGYKDYIDSKAKKTVSETRYEKDKELEELKEQVQQLINLKNNSATNPEMERINQELEAIKAQIASTNRNLSASATSESLNGQTAEDLFGPPPVSLSGSAIPSPSPYPQKLASPRTGQLSENDLFGPSPLANRGSSSQPVPSAPTSEPNLKGLSPDDLFGAPPELEELALNDAILNSSKPLTNRERHILKSPAIGKVTSYSEGLLSIDAGGENNITSGKTFQVRRGHQIIGQIQIEKVYKDQSVASFLNPGGGLAPQIGDQIIGTF